MGGFLFARQHGVDGPGPGPVPTSMFRQNEVTFIRNCRNSGTALRMASTSAKTRLACFEVHAALYISPRGSASGPIRWQGQARQ